MLYRRAALEDEDGLPDTTYGKSIFPEKLSTKMLKAQHEKDPFGFDAQMQNMPRAGKDLDFSKEWIRRVTLVDNWGLPCVEIPERFYDPEATVVEGEDPPQTVPLNYMSKVVILDPAGSRKSSRPAERLARNGIVCVGLDAWGRRYVLEAEAVRAPSDEVLRRCIDMALRWQAPTIKIEEIALQEVFQVLGNLILMREYGRDAKVQIGGVEPAGASKPDRIRALVGPMRNAFWYFNVAKCKKLVQEIVEYPGPTVDLVDAMAYTDRILRRPEAPYEAEARHVRDARSAGGADGRDSVTGY
jgi:hypothetical protein